MKKKKNLDTKDEIQSPNDMPNGFADAASTVDEKADVSFPIVGIGASAGGLAAFEAFFSGMPADTDPGMAFILVQHLAPDHKSILADLVKRYTRMQVFEVEDGMGVQPNCAYIIPPNRDMAFLNGTLQLMEQPEPRGQRMPIDFFFRSLAQDQRERAICVVLSGTGSDGTAGIRAVKGEGGVVLAQNPESTEYDGMPRSAISTGIVDYILPPVEMPAQIIAYVAHAFGKLPKSAAATTPKDENTLKKIFVLLRSQIGHDFSQYKTSTIQRRVERRMAVNQIETIAGYVKYLQQTAAEVDALFRDLLIGVTSFFRDPEVFKALEEHVIPNLLAGKLPNATIRFWSAGCSTGEEAYSIAILIQERLETMKLGYNAQVFATDIDGHAIATARAGLYPASIAADISPERLARFFTADPDNSMFRINKSIRDMLVFSEQNVVKDPPFSKLDLIICRNLMIYMSGELQKKLIPLFHYALNPGGFLLLGTSETTGDYDDLFAARDRKLKLYQRKDDIHRVQRTTPGNLFSPAKVDGIVKLQPPKSTGDIKTSLRSITEQTLLLQQAQTGVLVNKRGDIMFIHGRSGQYLEPVPGEAGPNNILKMAREGLRRELTTALHKVVRTKETVLRPGLQVKTNGGFSPVNLFVRPAVPDPVAEIPHDLFLVILEEAQAVEQDRPGTTALKDNVDVDSRIAALTQELRAKEEYLQTTTEQLQTTNEELKSSNEEMQSVNEELQSTNEELETSKEELQSLNEEMATVNAELQQKVFDLSQANNDMNNLLAGTGIGTVFVDHQMRILRFTPTATQIINLILSDVGRPVGHIVSNLVGYDSLVRDAQAVLDTLIPKEIELQTLKGDWYTMRIQPYRTVNNVIEGVVLTFVNITDMKKLLESRNEIKDGGAQ